MINVLLVILGALIPLLLFTEKLVLVYTERIIQLTKSSHNLEFETVIEDANYSNLEGYP